MWYWGRIGCFVLLSLGLHLELFGSMKPEGRSRRDEPVWIDVELQKQVAPAEEASVPPQPLKKIKARAIPEQQQPAGQQQSPFDEPAVDMQDAELEAPSDTALPPEYALNQAPGSATNAMRAIPSFGISMSSVTNGTGTGMAVPVGNTLRTQSSNRATSPQEVTPVAAARITKRLTRLPERAGDCEIPYPVTADDIEGLVVLALDISARGEVQAARVVTGVDPVLDEAALRGIKSCRFVPGERDGRAVPIINLIFKYRFILE